MRKQTLKIKENLIIDEIDNELIIFEEDSEMTYLLNEIGAFIFKNSEGQNKEDIAKKLFSSLEDNSNVSFEELNNDCEIYIQNLVKKGLIYYVE